MFLVLTGLQWKTLLVYLDDVIVVSKSFSLDVDVFRKSSWDYNSIDWNLKQENVNWWPCDTIALDKIRNVSIHKIPVNAHGNYAGDGDQAVE